MPGPEWTKIGIQSGRRSMWVFLDLLDLGGLLTPENINAIHLRAGREGDDAQVTVNRASTDPAVWFGFVDVITAAMYAVECGEA